MTKTWDDVLKEKKIIGFNDRGIVMYNSETKDAICQNCGELLHGEEYQFGHIGCPKPSGLYITNTATAEDIISAFYQIMEEYNKQKEYELLQAHMDGIKEGS